ncbi:MAG: hypothetical protein OXC03_02560 [Flavobacteriaceae bacterium]|nr:hypothetical protein [Flavobacteriaceae bacterium]
MNGPSNKTKESCILKPITHEELTEQSYGKINTPIRDIYEIGFEVEFLSEKIREYLANWNPKFIKDQKGNKIMVNLWSRIEEPVNELLKHPKISSEHSLKKKLDNAIVDLMDRLKKIEIECEENLEENYKKEQSIKHKEKVPEYGK